MRFLLLPFLGIALATLDSRQIKDCQFIGPSKTACHLGRNDSSATVMKLTKDNYYQFACTGLGESKGHGEKNNSYVTSIWHEYSNGRANPILIASHVDTGTQLLSTQVISAMFGLVMYQTFRVHQVSSTSNRV